jgi:hypothetical protein
MVIGHSLINPILCIHDKGTLPHNGNRLKAAMGMLSHALGPIRRFELRRAGIIEQQEGANLFTLRMIRNHGVDRKSVSNPMCACTATDSRNFLIFMAFLSFF